MTGIIVKVKHRFPALWSIVESVNGGLCRLRFIRRSEAADAAIASLPPIEGYAWSRVEPNDAEALSRFFTRQKEERLTYFRPHRFDPATLRRMARSGGFVMLKVTAATSGEIVGYHFLRLFFNGTIFHGLIVGEGHEGHGLGTQMWRLGAAIAESLGSDMEATISEANAASLTSCRNAVEVVETTPIADGYLHLRLRPRR